MSHDLEREISDIKRTVQENNKILKKIQASHRRSIILGWIKWAVYISLLIGAYTLLKPFLDQIIQTYSVIQESAGTLSDIKTQTQGINLNSLLENFR